MVTALGLHKGVSSNPTALGLATAQVRRTRALEAAARPPPRIAAARDEVAAPRARATGGGRPGDAGRGPCASGGAGEDRERGGRVREPRQEPADRVGPRCDRLPVVLLVDEPAGHAPAARPRRPTPRAAVLDPASHWPGIAGRGEAGADRRRDREPAARRRAARGRRRDGRGEDELPARSRAPLRPGA